MRALIRAAEFHTDLAEPGREKVFRGDETTPEQRPEGTRGVKPKAGRKGKRFGVERARWKGGVRLIGSRSPRACPRTHTRVSYIRQAS